MRKIKIKKTTPPINFEGNQYPAGTWLVANRFVAAEPEGYVYHENDKRVVATKMAGVTSHQTADKLLHNWPDLVSEVKPPKKQVKKPVKKTAK